MVISQGGRFCLLYRGLASECYRVYELNPVFSNTSNSNRPVYEQTKKYTFPYIFFDIDQSQTTFDSPLDLALLFLLFNLNNLRIKSLICLILSILYRLVPKSSPPVDFTQF